MTADDEARTRHRRRMLAAVLLAGSGLVDTLAGVADVNEDQYVAITREGLYRLNVTGWMWAHLVAGALMVVAGGLLFSGRRWPHRFAAAVAVTALAVHLILFPFRPVWAIIMIGVTAAALRLLWRCRPGAVSP